MKIIHTADLHLNSPLHALSNEKAKVRREELLATFERLVSYAKNNDVKAIIIAGDMFDGARVLTKTKNRVLYAITSNPEITFLYLSGNHDKDNFIDGLELIPSNLFVFSDEWSSIKIDDVRFSGVCINELNALSIYDRLKLNENDVNVVVLHGQIAGYKSSEKGEIISIPRLREKFIDYLALGHIHSFVEGDIDIRGKYVYSGCLEGRGFDEVGEKGFVLIDASKNGVHYSFMPFAFRQMYEMKFQIDENIGWYDLQQAILNKADECDASGLLKLVLTGEHSADYYIDKENLLNKLNQKFFFAKIDDQTEINLKSEDYMLDKSVRGEFIRSVMDSDLSQEMKNKVVLCGLKALKGEEL